MVNTNCTCFITDNPSLWLLWKLLDTFEPRQETFFLFLLKNKNSSKIKVPPSSHWSVLVHDRCKSNRRCLLVRSSGSRSDWSRRLQVVPLKRRSKGLRCTRDAIKDAYDWPRQGFSSCDDEPWLNECCRVHLHEESSCRSSVTPKTILSLNELCAQTSTYEKDQLDQPKELDENIPWARGWLWRIRCSSGTFLEESKR